MPKQNSVTIPSSVDPQGKLADQLAILAFHLLLLSALTEERRKFRHWIPFSSNTWRWHFGCRYPLIKRAAVDQGLIEVNERFSTGQENTKRFPKSIRLAKQHLDSSVRTYRFQKPRIVNRSPGPERDLDDVSRWLIGQQRLASFDRAVFSEDLVSMDHLLLDQLINRCGWGHRCDYGRFHSPVTSISKRFRSHLNLNGLNTVELDISNSQALLLGILSCNGITKQRPDTGETQGYPGSYSICCIKNGQPLPSLPNDLVDWLELSEAGQLYEFFEERFQSGEVSEGDFIQTIDPETVTRDEIKRLLMYATFAKNEDMTQNAIWKLLVSHFPTMASFMFNHKRNGHQRLAHEYQRFESALIIDGVCGRIMNERPTMPVLTVHDCLICTENDLPTVREMMRNQFEAFGVTPHLKDKSPFASTV